MKDARFDKVVVLVNALVPGALLGWDAWRHHLGANPIEYATHTTGTLTLIFLMMTLAVTPLRKITGRNYWSHFRRMLGLVAFTYACVHLILYFVFYQSLDFAKAYLDALDRPFIFIGLAAFLMLVPLAVTSTNGMIRLLGADRWKRLHRLVYWAAAAGVLHYWLLVKADTTRPLAFATVLALLLGYRLVLKRYPNLHRPRPRPTAVPPAAPATSAP